MDLVFIVLGLGGIGVFAFIWFVRGAMNAERRRLELEKEAWNEINEKTRKANNSLRSDPDRRKRVRDRFNN